MENFILRLIDGGIGFNVLAHATPAVAGATGSLESIKLNRLVISIVAGWTQTLQYVYYNFYVKSFMQSISS